MRAADLDLGVTLVLTPGFYAPAFREGSFSEVRR